jgi:ribosomal protein L11 methylase PrmA
MVTLLNGLSDVVKKLTVKKDNSTWDNYYTDTILGDAYINAKQKILLQFVELISFETVTDLGANEGYFSLLLKDKAKQIIAIDADSNCINKLYLELKKKGIKNIFPVVNELNNPSPAIGWNNEEREKLDVRINADLVMALALVHHLAIAQNIPLSFIANWLAPICNFLIIEFIPKSDPKVQELLKNRRDIFNSYNIEDFKFAFLKKFILLKEEKVAGTERTLFLFRVKSAAE